MKVIIELCQQCSSFLHNSYGRFLEIVFDILLTLDKGPIILEANSKPSRWFFNILAEYYKEDGKRRAFFQEQRKKAVSAPLIFALKINSEHI